MIWTRDRIKRNARGTFHTRTRALFRYANKCLFAVVAGTSRRCTILHQHQPFAFAAKNYRDGSFHEPLSIISYRLAHLRPHLQPCTEWPAISFSIFLACSLSRGCLVPYLFEFRCLSTWSRFKKILSFPFFPWKTALYFSRRKCFSYILKYSLNVFISHTYRADSFLCEYQS